MRTMKRSARARSVTAPVCGTVGDMPSDLHEQNRRSWNHATVAHESHKPGQGAWLRAGGTTLFPEELALLGELSGRSLVHLQCNAGADTVSLARRGASVVGVDISDEAIARARVLAGEAGAAARFERADVHDWLEACDDTFDLAFASYGALCWLSDLGRWARGVARVLRGRLVIMEFHPALYGIDWKDGAWTLGPTRGGGGARHDWSPGVGDYVGDSGAGLVPSGYTDGVVGFANPEACVEFEWSLGDVVDAIARAGLVIETVCEYPYSNGCRFWPSMVEGEGRRFRLPPDAPQVPLMVGVVAHRT